MRNSKMNRWKKAMKTYYWKQSKIEANYTPFSKTKEVKDSVESKKSQKGSF